MAAGWIYVLVNSAMPGLVKVGKTTRDPLQRANELSGVTSVATPFVLAFQEYFADCDAAEMLVHRQLTRDGHREADNREFFRASPSDVIKTILAIAENVGGLDVPSSLAMGAAGGISPNSPPWMTIESEADAYYFGLGNCLQDYDEARKLYLDAMRLGSSVACERVGDIYHYGEGTPQDDNRRCASTKKEQDAETFSPCIYGRGLRIRRPGRERLKVLAILLQSARRSRCKRLRWLGESILKAGERALVCVKHLCR